MRMYKKVLVILTLLLIYIAACWTVDMISSKIVLDASGHSYHIKNHFFHNEYVFSGSDTEWNIKLDRIFLLCTAVVYLTLIIMKKIKKS